MVGFYTCAKRFKVKGMRLQREVAGWLCLEDWFFSGEDGRFVSPDGKTC